MGQRRPAAGAGPAPPPGPPALRHSPPYISAHWQRGGPRRSSAGGTPGPGPSSASGASVGVGASPAGPGLGSAAEPRDESTPPCAAGR